MNLCSETAMHENNRLPVFAWGFVRQEAVKVNRDIMCSAGENYMFLVYNQNRIYLKQY